MIPAGYVSAAPLVRVLNYAEQNGVPTEPLRRRMQLELDMPVLLDSTVPLITAMNAIDATRRTLFIVIINRLPLLRFSCLMNFY